MSVNSIDDDVAQTFSEQEYNMSDDDNVDADLLLSDLERIEKYITSEIVFQRLIHVKLLYRIIPTSTLDEIRECIIPIVGALSEDPEEEICDELCKCSYPIAERIINDDQSEGIGLCSEFLYPLLWNIHLNYQENQSISNTILNTISQLATYFSHEINYEMLVPQLLEFLLNGSDPTISLSISVLSFISDHLDSSAIIEIILPEIIQLLSTSRNTVFLTAIPSYFAYLMKDPSFHPVLLPVIKEQLKHSLWNVREKVASVLPEIVEHCDVDSQAELLSSCSSLYDDRSKWVRISYKKAYGYILGYLDISLITEEMIQQYCKIATSTDDNEEFALAHSFAFTLPGVLTKTGVQFWDCIRSCYESLFSHLSTSIQETIAASLGIVKSIVLDRMEDMFAMNAFSTFLHSMNSDIVMASLRSTAELFSSLHENSQHDCFNILKQFAETLIDNTFNWRVQNTLFEQLVIIISKCSSSLLLSSLLSLIQLGIHDQTYAEMTCSIQCFPAFLQKCKEMSDFALMKECLLILFDLQSKTYYFREGIDLSFASLQENEELMKMVKEMIIVLKEDKVENIKEEIQSLLEKHPEL